jgi:hypothetical protein
MNCCIHYTSKNKFSFNQQNKHCHWIANKTNEIIPMRIIAKSNCQTRNQLSLIRTKTQTLKHRNPNSLDESISKTNHCWSQLRLCKYICFWSQDQITDGALICKWHRKITTDCTRINTNNSLELGINIFQRLRSTTKFKTFKLSSNISKYIQPKTGQHQIAKTKSLSILEIKLKR